MILVLDYGSQYTQLIARRVRELNVFSTVVPYDTELNKDAFDDVEGIILSGGPQSVYAEEGYPLNQAIFDFKVPVLGICYGAQLLVENFGGKVTHATEREFGRAALKINNHDDLFKNLERETKVWMSHGDKITTLPVGFETIGVSDNSPHAAIKNSERQLFAVQFHPEVTHTAAGKEILENFVVGICDANPSWTPHSFVENTTQQLKEQIGAERVLCGASGGVDSTVLATLLHHAVGAQSVCIFVDNGLLRKGEAEVVQDILGNRLKLNLVFEDASSEFLKNLKGVEDPEKKRKIIGHTFIDVFERLAKKQGGARFLGQGTLYPDLIESVSHRGPSQTIKSHHNVGGLPENMKLELVEPLKELFKDEVRLVGADLDIPAEILNRHPFPGPGLAVRVLGEVTEARVKTLQEADAIFIEGLKEANLYDHVWQALAVLLPVHTVGVMGDARTYENVCALRAVTSTDGMTADWAQLPFDFLADMSTRIINEVKGINRVVYDISSKPPSTIEWE